MAGDSDVAREDREKRDAFVETEGSRWWAEFIEHFAAKGVDRRDLNEAVVRFRAAQEALADTINSTK